MVRSTRRADGRLGIAMLVAPVMARNRQRARLVGVGFMIATILLVVVGPLPVPTWDVLPVWWVPGVCLLAGCLMLMAAEL
jgi:hypothetical protein